MQQELISENVLKKFIIRDNLRNYQMQVEKYMRILQVGKHGQFILENLLM